MESWFRVGRLSSAVFMRDSASLAEIDQTKEDACRLTVASGQRLDTTVQLREHPMAQANGPLVETPDVLAKRRGRGHT